MSPLGNRRAFLSEAGADLVRQALLRRPGVAGALAKAQGFLLFFEPYLGSLGVKAFPMEPYFFED